MYMVLFCAESGIDGTIHSIGRYGGPYSSLMAACNADSALRGLVKTQKAT